MQLHRQNSKAGVTHGNRATKESRVVTEGNESEGHRNPNDNGGNASQIRNWFLMPLENQDPS